MNSLYHIDDLVKEYLLFRGFTNAFRALETESRQDKDKGFQVDRVIDELLGYIDSGDIQKLISYYQYLDVRFFSRLESRFQRTVKKFELCLLRHYLVHAIQRKKKEKVVEFFDCYGADLHGKPEWSPWFALPYLKDPASDPMFEAFFSKQWVDNYKISLHNFLATTFQNMPMPSLLSLNIDRTQLKTQHTEIEQLKSTLDSLKTTVEARDQEIIKLKLKATETHKEEMNGAAFIRRRAASMVHGPASDSLKDAPSIRLDTTGIHPYDATTLGDETVFSEHASAITHAKFSGKGDSIASCDMDNIVRTWSYNGGSSRRFRSDANILSLDWAKSGPKADSCVLLGTDTGEIHVYDVDKNKVVHQFQTDRKGTTFPWTTQLSSFSGGTVFTSVGSGNKMVDTKQPCGLFTWDLKAMSGPDMLKTATDDTCTDINTIHHNHNGNMLVAGDDAGWIRIFDTRTKESISAWKLESGLTPCAAQFSLEENVIYTIDQRGQLVHWSVHKPGEKHITVSLDGFPTLPVYAPPKRTSTPLPLPADPPRPTANPSTSSISRLSISSSRSGSRIQDESVPQMLLSVAPRPQMVAFDASLGRVLCASSCTAPASGSPLSASASLVPPSSHSATPPSSSTTQGIVYSVLDGRPVHRFTPHTETQRITSVDWRSESNACLLATADGSIKVNTHPSLT